MTTFKRSHKEVLELLGVNVHQLRQRMRDDPEGPWIDISTGKRPTYRWSDGDNDIWEWWEKACQVSINEGSGIKSSGGKVAGKGRTASGRSNSRGKSRSKSKRPSTEEKRGSLIDFAGALTDRA